jgi:hypothetical protein
MPNPELDKYVRSSAQRKVMNNIKFDLTIDEANLVLMALAKQPFEQVVGLMNKLQGQAKDQLPQQNPPAGK